jgi:hypothetical protein
MRAGGLDKPEGYGEKLFLGSISSLVMLKCIILPRQARDKHRESKTQKVNRFLNCRYGEDV